ncbi:AEC family transporter [Nitratireductor alexandrii]|uniref:AEC family transporter n=1 Tax=Nitratireductor alexandrii TaxID=2448161 RepID=UPI000FDBC0C8|nr:AEC family transporter [Nitratireductor alexandrii]
MSAEVEAVLFIFGLIALGYLAGVSGYLKAEAGDALAEFAVSVAVPLLLFKTMQSADFHGAASWSLWITYFTSVAIAWALGQFVTTRVFGRDARAGVVGGVSASFSNTVLLGIPLVLGVFGQAGFEILALIVSVHLVVMMAASIVVFAILDGSRDGAPRPVALVSDFFGKLLRNPLIIGILAGLAFRFTGLQLPGLGLRFVDALAGIAGPLALFSIGLGLRRYGIAGNLRAGVALAGLKLIVMPAATLALALALGLPPLAAQVAVITASLPTGVNAYLIAVQFGTGQAISTNAMMIATSCAAVTTSLWLLVLQAVFG